MPLPSWVLAHFVMNFLRADGLSSIGVEPDVGTVEARADHDRPVESEIPGDFRDLSFRRGRGESGDDGACGQLCDEFADAHVAWAEVVSPLEHAVRLVDGDEVHAGGLGESGEIVGEQALRATYQDAQASPWAMS